jgi:hypothetical protein
LSAFTKLFKRLGDCRTPIKVLSASGQLGYGIPEKSLAAGLARDPDFVGCDMGSIDPGPAYLGSGQMATSPMVTRRDLRLVLLGTVPKGIPLIIGTAGTAGASPHLDETVRMVREIAQEEGLKFRLATINADIPNDMVCDAIDEDRLQSIGPMPELTKETVEATCHIVGQMGMEAFVRAMEQEPDVIIAGRACDTAVFAAIPQRLGYSMGEAMHMAKIIECTSICCSPGGRDAMLGILDDDGFILESMNPELHATPTSVAAHSLYEQADPNSISEPDGTLYLNNATYEPVDEHRLRVNGARWVSAKIPTVKIEGSARLGERAVLIAGTVDPIIIDRFDEITAEVEAKVRTILPSDENPWQLIIHPYGLGAIRGNRNLAKSEEVGIILECIAETADMAKSVVAVTKQYLLHHGFDGRISTGGNIAFPFTPAELDAGTAYRFSIYHIMTVLDLEPLFPVHIEQVG